MTALGVRTGRRRFHVDDLSSAHVYLRLPDGIDLDHIPETTLEDCCQLVKANSIQVRLAPSCHRFHSPVHTSHNLQPECWNGAAHLSGGPEHCMVVPN